MAAVFWWLGATLAACACVASMSAAQHGLSLNAIFMLCMGLLFVLPAWATAFVLGGSFWRPPKA